MVAFRSDEGTQLDIGGKIGGVVERAKRLPPMVWLVVGGIILAVLFLGKRGGGGGGIPSTPVSAGTTGGGGGGGDSGVQSVIGDADLLAALNEEIAARNSQFSEIQSQLALIKPGTGGTAVQPAGRPTAAQIAAWTKAIRYAPTWNKNISAQIAALKRGGVTAAEKPKIAALVAKQRTHNATIARYKTLLAKK